MPMLHEFLTANYHLLVARCRAKVVNRRTPWASDAELLHGIPLFLEQLIRTLQVEETGTPLESRKVSGAAEPERIAVDSDIGTSAAKHGNELLRQGFTVDQVVHDYGDLCQAITELALELDAPVSTDEFRTLNRCLDNAIGDAVTEFGRQRDNAIATEGAHAVAERLGALAHELRNLLNSAMLAVVAIKAGEVGLAGATGAVLDRSLLGLRNVIDRSLVDVRLAVGLPAAREHIDLAEFIAEVKVAGSLEATAKGCVFIAAPVEDGLVVLADRQMLSSAVANLLQNAFKFTRGHSDVELRVSREDDRVLIEIQDECGGLPQGAAERLFLPFEQAGDNRTGLGLGLSITQRSVEANGGLVRVRDVPGSGCVFTIDLPLRSAAPHAELSG
jgi:signal transduction histidine kinase